jgi:hypothetical protein
VGFVKVDGCMIQLEDVQAEHRIVASVNECTQEGKAIVEKFAPDAFKVFFSDRTGASTLWTVLRRNNSSSKLQTYS